MLLDKWMSDRGREQKFKKTQVSPALRRLVEGGRRKMAAFQILSHDEGAPDAFALKMGDGPNFWVSTLLVVATQRKFRAEKKAISPNKSSVGSHER